MPMLQQRCTTEIDRTVATEIDRTVTTEVDRTVILTREAFSSGNYTTIPVL